MRIGWHIILYLFLFNMICGLLYAISVPGTSFSNILYGTGDTEDYQERVDPGALMNKTDPEASETFTFVGQIWNGLSLIWDSIRFTVFGFPTMMQGIGDQIQDPTAKTAFTNISTILYAAIGLIISFWIYELLTGRKVED